MKFKKFFNYVVPLSTFKKIKKVGQFCPLFRSELTKKKKFKNFLKNPGIKKKKNYFDFDYITKFS